MRTLITCAAAAILAAAPAFAGQSGVGVANFVENPILEGETWAELRENVTEAEVLKDGEELLYLSAPVQAFDAAFVPFSIRQNNGTGERITKVTIVVDENPAPVAAEFTFGPLMGDIHLESRVRYDVYSNIRVLAETETGETFMSGRFVEAAGGCSAPVTRDLAESLATMGEMKLKHFRGPVGAKPAASGAVKEAQVMIRHPMFTGMQRDLTSQDLIDPRFITEIEVSLGDDVLWTMTGGFSISENPVFRFKYRDNGAQSMTVRAVDTEGAEFIHTFAVNTGA